MLSPHNSVSTNNMILRNLNPDDMTFEFCHFAFSVAFDLHHSLPHGVSPEGFIGWL